jgi:predicted dehydrogenase
MRIGLVGGGNISETHASAASSIPGLEIVAIFGSNPDRVSALARRYGAAPYHTLEAFVAHRPMEVVAIGSPSGLHAAHGVTASRHGLHVLVEKPIDITTARADQLIAETDRTGVKLGVFFQERLHPAIVETKRLIDDGVVGAPVSIAGRVKWYRPPEYYARSRWRGTWALDGGGALMNQGIHTVDLLQWMFGRVARVHGTIATRLHAIEVEDTAAAILEFASGAMGTLEVATSAFPGYPRRIEVTGTRGTLILEHDRLVTIDLHTPPPHPPTAGGTDQTASASSPVVADATAHARVLEDFIRAIETGGAPACDGREGRRSVAIVEAIYQSARERRAVELSCD